MNLNSPERPSRIWPYAIIHLLAAIWLDFTTFHKLHFADSFIYVLGSLYEWRPFYWEISRNGMGVPLLAIGFRDPFHNLLVQTGIMTFLGLMLPLLLARAMSTNRYAPMAATIGNIIFIAFAPERFHRCWLIVCNYPGGLVLAFLAMALLDTRSWGNSRKRRLLRLLLALLLFTLANYQYFGIVVFLGPLFFFRAWANTGPGAVPQSRSWWRVLLRPFFDRRAVASLVLLGIGLGIVGLLMWYTAENYPHVLGTGTETVAIADWPTAWHSMVEATAELPGMVTYSRVLLGISGIGFVLSLLMNRGELWRTIGSLIPLLLAALVEYLFMGTRGWLALNEYDSRYFTASVTAVSLALVLLGWLPILSRIPIRYERFVILLLGVLLLASAGIRYGLPTSRIVRTTLDDEFGTLTEFAIAHDCEAIGGTYWTVWPSVFHANLTLAERGEPQGFTGICERGSVFRERWQSFGPTGFRVVSRIDEEWNATYQATRYGLAPLVLIEQHGELGIYRTHWTGKFE